MPWFWYLVDMSSQISLCLPKWPNLLTQPFNQTPHKNQSNLNLYAWPLVAQKSRNQRFTEAVPARIEAPQSLDQISLKRSGPFLHSGASVIRWTSQLPPVSIPGKEVTAKYNGWLNISHSRQTGKFAH